MSIKLNLLEPHEFFRDNRLIPHKKYMDVLNELDIETNKQDFIKWRDMRAENKNIFFNNAIILTGSKIPSSKFGFNTKELATNMYHILSKQYSFSPYMKLKGQARLKGEHRFEVDEFLKSIYLNPKLISYYYEYFLPKRTDMGREYRDFSSLLQGLTEMEDVSLYYDIYQKKDLLTKSVGHGPITDKLYKTIDTFRLNGKKLNEITLYDILKYRYPLSDTYNAVVGNMSFKQSAMFDAEWITEYNIRDKIKQRPGYSLYIQNWWFPPNIFCMAQKNKKPFSINWNTNNPFELK
jgi:hypothetical protein